jgi:hypothetical protein
VAFYREELHTYLSALALLPAALLLLSVLYFPSSPPRPPSASSLAPRAPILPSLVSLAASPQAWALLVVGALSQAVPGTWMAMMVTDLTKVGRPHCAALHCTALHCTALH